MRNAQYIIIHSCFLFLVDLGYLQILLRIGHRYLAVFALFFKY
jgi:hypothetical protein